MVFGIVCEELRIRSVSSKRLDYSLWRLSIETEFATKSDFINIVSQISWLAHNIIHIGGLHHGLVLPAELL